MKVLIVEDEALAAVHLANLLGRNWPEIKIMAVSDSIAAAVAVLQEATPELIFMDIQLGDGLSFEIFNQVEIKAPVIFTTAYDHYALEAFQRNGIGYLLKPILEQALNEAISRYESFIKPDIKSPWLQDLIRTSPLPDYRRRFMVNSGSKLKSIPIEDIAWFKAEGRYVRLVTASNQQFLINDSLEKLEESLNPKQFTRANRSYLVSAQAIVSLVVLPKSKLKLELNPTDAEEVIVSAERAALIRQWLDH